MLVGQWLQVDAATVESRREVSQRTAVLSLSCFGMRKGTEWWLSKDAKRNYLPASCDPGGREQQMFAEMDQVELS